MTELELARKAAAQYFQIKSELEASDNMRIRKIKESEIRFMKLFDLCPVPVFLMKVADYRLQMVNDAFSVLVETDKSLIIAKTLVNLGFADPVDFEKFVSEIAPQAIVITIRS